MNKNTVNPIGLKGNEELQHIQELMGKLSPVNEAVRNSVVELTKKAADGVIYAIVRENHNYFIKTASQKKGPLVTEDFQYIGGLQNKTDESYPTYAKALKRLNGKLISIAENADARGEINTFANEHLLSMEQANPIAEEACEGCNESDEEITENQEDFSIGSENWKNFKKKDDSIEETVTDEAEDEDEKDFQTEHKISSILKAINEEDEGYCNAHVLPKGISEVFESLDDIKKKNLAETTQELDEIKYKLKVPAQSNEMPSANSFGGSEEPSAPVDNQEPAFGDAQANDQLPDDKPFDDKPFDAGVAADEESDPKHFIQQLAGKLGTTIRSYTETQGQPDLELEKFAINSVISATHTNQMDPEDQKEIISKIKTAGQGDESNDTEEDIPEPDANDGVEPELPPDEEIETEEVIIEFEENIAKNLPIKENFSTFVENIIKKKMNKEIYLTETVDEVFSIIGADNAEPDKETETPVKEPGTKEKEPDSAPTRRNKPWKVPRIKETPDPKAMK